MSKRDEEQYREEARRKIAEANKKARVERQKNNASSKVRPTNKPRSNSSRANSPRVNNEENTGIKTWTGLDTKERQAKGERLARQQNQARKIKQDRQAQVQKKRRVQASKASKVDDSRARTPKEKEMVNARLREIQAKRNRQRAVMLSVLVVLVLTVTSTLIYLLLNQEEKHANLQFIYEGSLLESYPAQALIVRDETLTLAETSGTIMPTVAEGYYARVGEEVALVIGADMNNTLTELENYRRQISDVQLEMIDEGQVLGASTVYTETEKKLSPLVSDLRRTIGSGRYQQVAKDVEAINQTIEERTDLLADVLVDNAILDALNAEKAVLEQRLAVNSQSLLARKAGLISFSSDGLEDELTAKRMSSITSEEVQEYLKNTAAIPSIPRDVQNGAVMLRQVVGIEQYFAMVVDSMTYSLVSEREKIGLYLPTEDLRIDGVEIVNAEPRVGGVYLVLKTDQALAHLLDARSVRVDVIVNEAVGLKVPRTALRTDDELASTSKLTVVQNGYYRVMDVMVVASDQDFVIVEAANEGDILRQGSLIVLNPDAVTEGSLVND